jgi:hypothetical protein
MLPGVGSFPSVSRARGIGEGGENVGACGKPLAVAIGCRKTLLRVGDGGGKEFGQRTRAPAAIQRVPGIHQARHGRGCQPMQRNAIGKTVRRCGLRGRAGSVERDCLTGLGLIDDDKRVAADMAGIWLDHAENGGGGNGGVRKTPPCCKTFSPAETASGCEAAIIPFFATTTPRCCTALILFSP